MGILEYFEFADGFRGKGRETQFFEKCGRQWNIYFSATTGPKMHQQVWNFPLGTGLGDGEVELRLFSSIVSSPTVLVVLNDATRGSEYLGLLVKLLFKIFV